MKFSNKVHMFVIYLFLVNWGCEGKRDAIGSDNEIRVICSDIDKEKYKAFP